MIEVWAGEVWLIDRIAGGAMYTSWAFGRILLDGYNLVYQIRSAIDCFGVLHWALVPPPRQVGGFSVDPLRRTVRK